MKVFKILAKELEELEGENLFLKEKLGVIKPTPERNMYFAKRHGKELGPFCLKCSKEFDDVQVSSRAGVEKGWSWQCQCCGKIID